MKLTSNLKRTGVFWAVTIGYGLFYVCRLSLNVLKKAMVDDGFLTESQLGIIGSALFFSYAIGKLANGFLADRLNIKYFMAGSLLICAIANFILGFEVPFLLFVVIWGINGWFQSAGAPCSIIGLKRWYSEKGLGTVYGFWSSSHNIGEAITFVFTAFIVSTLGWQWGFFSASTLGLIGCLLIFFLLIPHPQHQIVDVSPISNTKNNVGKMQLSVLKNPMIWLLALGSGFMYIARYAVNSWGIFYFEIEKGYSIVEASTLVSISSVCGIIGTIFSGVISDKFFNGSRTIPTVIMSVLNMIALAMFLFIPQGNYLLDVVSMMLYGVSIGVLICFLGGLMAVDIAPSEAVGAAVGVIGIASYFAAGLQDIVSGALIESKKQLIDGVFVYDFSHIRFFWLTAAALSLTLLLIIWNKQTKKA